MNRVLSICQCKVKDQFFSRSVFGELQLTQISLNVQKFFLKSKNERHGSKTKRSFSVILILKGINDFLNSKSPLFFLNKNINFKKIENQRWKIPHILWERRNVYFSSYKNCELKVKPWRIGVQQVKKTAFFVRFIWSERNFFNICVLSQCIVYWVNFQNTYTFTY